jgi:ubiquinone/menaquinone biosynthesis C-methylase UbiE
MSSFDVFGMTDKLPAPVLDAIVTRLESRGNHPLFQTMLHEYLDAMAIDSARTVLDVGCGTGVAARNIARRPQFTGSITGIDVSAYLVKVAQRLTTEEGIRHRIDFRVGDSRTLDIPDKHSMPWWPIP